MRTAITILRKYVPRQFVIKIFGWCNLACDYCYMYEMADQTWRRKPKVMSDETIDMAVRRIAEYIREHELQSLSIVFHGGEPFLAGMAKIRRFIEGLNEAASEYCDITYGIQSNGTLITEEILDECVQLKLTIGLSLDGDVEGNSLRKYHNGKSSYGDVVSTLNLMRPSWFKKALNTILRRKQRHYSPLFRSFLSYVRVTPDKDGVMPPSATETYKALTRWGSMEPLLPLGNHTNHPPGLPAKDGETPYADWCLELFRHWVKKGFQPDIPMFTQFIKLIMAQYYPDFKLLWYEHTEMFGEWAMGAICVDVDGAYEGPDWFKSVAEGASATGLNVRDHKATSALRVVLNQADELGLVEASSYCQQNHCGIYKICGGGLPAHRAKTDEHGNVSYDNPSVYCEDIQKLVAGIINELELHARVFNYASQVVKDVVERFVAIVDSN